MTLVDALYNHYSTLVNQFLNVLRTDDMVVRWQFKDLGFTEIMQHQSWLYSVSYFLIWLGKNDNFFQLIKCRFIKKKKVLISKITMKLVIWLLSFKKL